MDGERAEKQTLACVNIYRLDIGKEPSKGGRETSWEATAAVRAKDDHG